MPENNTLLPVYLCTGEDLLFQKQIIEKMVNRLFEDGEEDFNSNYFNGSSVQTEELLNALEQLPFGPEKRLVVIRDIEGASKDTLEALALYAMDPSETTVLIITGQLKKSTKLYKAVSKLSPKACIDCTPKAKREFQEQASKIAKSKGLVIDYSALTTLIEYVGENPLRLDVELNKILIALGPHSQVTQDVIEQMVSRTTEPTPWEIIDAIFSRNTKLTFQLLGKLFAPDYFALFNLILFRLRQVISVRALLDRPGNPSQNVEAGLGLKANEKWKAKKLIAEADNFTAKELNELLIQALELDHALKSGADKQICFECWILNICVSTYVG